MITKTQLRNLVQDSNNRFTHITEVPWEQTSLSRLYDTVDAQIEGGSLIDIVSAKPIGFDAERQTIKVEMVLDCSDLFEEQQEDEDYLDTP